MLLKFTGRLGPLVHPQIGPEGISPGQVFDCPPSVAAEIQEVAPTNFCTPTEEEAEAYNKLKAEKKAKAAAKAGKNAKEE